MSDLSPIWDTDDLPLYFVVGDEENPGQAKDLSGATLEAEAKRTDTVADAIPATTVTVADAAAGRVYVHFAKGSFENKPGRYGVQLRVALGATNLQTVGVAILRVNASSKPAA